MNIYIDFICREIDIEMNLNDVKFYFPPCNKNKQKYIILRSKDEKILYKRPRGFTNFLNRDSNITCN